MADWESSSEVGKRPPKVTDIDKHLPDNRPADGTAAAATNKGAQDSAKPFLTYKDAKLWVNDGIRATIFQGITDLGQSALRVLKPEAPLEFDVFNAPDEWLIFNSAQNMFKIAKIIYITIPAYSVTVPAVAGQASGQSTVVSVEHELGYRPAFEAFVEDTAFVGSDGLPSYRSAAQVELPLYVGAPGGFATTATRVWVENDNVIARGTTVVYVGGAGYGSTLNIPAKNLKVYLFQETAN